jgi:putative membrane protein
MARKLYRFTTLLAVPALGLGLWLWLGYGIGRGRATAGCTPSWRWCCW